MEAEEEGCLDPGREEDATIALLRQQQEIMAQMVEQQQRTSAVTELRRGPFKYQRSKPPVDLVVAPRTPERAPDPEAQPEAADWRRIALAVATSAAKAAGRRPTFAGLDTENPAEFLEECERYSTDAQVPPEKKLSEAIRCLRQTATRWAQFHQATYWSAGQQLAVRARVLSQRYNLTKVDSTVDFFMEQATQLRTLTQPIWECVMVEDLMRLFPENISLLFKSEKPRGERSIQGALDFLERQGGTTSNRTDTTSATTKDGFVCRRRRNEEAEPFLCANLNKSPIGKRRQDVDGRCSHPLKASQTSTFPRIKFVTARFGEDKYPCCPGFSILGIGRCTIAPLTVLSRRECATLYPRELWALHRLGWRPSPAGINPDRPGLRTPLGLLFKDTLYRPETFRHDPLMLANVLDQAANTPYEATKRTSRLPHTLNSIHQEELLALLDSGSEVTCINEDQFAILSAKARILTLPVKGALDLDANSLSFVVNDSRHTMPFHLDSFLREKSETPQNPTTMPSLVMSAIPEPTPVDLAKTVTPFQVLQEKVDTISSLDPIQRSSLLAVLFTHQSAFNELPGRTPKYVHVIKMHDYTPFVKRAYPIAFSLRPEVEKVIQQMLQLGVMKREASPFASPMMTVIKKKDGTVRICLDARGPVSFAPVHYVYVGH
ncbi:hypothetical protein GEV33_001458 [Tenebrio molitor]|uniref:Uncharacterized protein n=1 Tax=Tenebrio molitor TaxID=7067 RepID=A0A8J6LJI3_TENMO|nr:hypothetical protein GEV33_001458 [Tenebrio molitor]